MDDNRINDVENENFDEEENNIVVLKDEDGNDVRFEFLDLIEYNNDNYVVLLPAEESEDGDEVVILKEDKESETGDEEEYISVDDEDVLNKVFAIFKEKFKDEFNFEDWNSIFIRYYLMWGENEKFSWLVSSNFYVYVLGI